MSTPVIQAEGLSKRYRIGLAQRARRSLRESLSELGASLARRLTGRADGLPGGDEAEIWALKDVGFSVEQGDAVGIVGGNGAGKSTLLKVLSRITEPTEGRVLLHGRVASLLEVGTGFHGDLTGRENVFLNGAILGMTRPEIRRKFDEIVAFSEVGRFIDTPVKRYSSGMQMRLAFAVAAHLEPEILVVDEVLAVGDEAFQRKCLGKMESVTGEGRTVLFVSHNMAAVEKLCRSAIWLQAGKIEAAGRDVRGILNRYHEAASGGVKGAAESTATVDSPWLTLNGFRLVDRHGRTWREPIPNDAPAFVEVALTVKKIDRALMAGYTLYDDDGLPLYMTTSIDGPESAWPEWRLGRIVLRSELPRRLLNEGTYRASLFIDVRGRQWIVSPGDGAPSIRFTVRGGLNDSPAWHAARPGRLAPVIAWGASRPTESGAEDESRIGGAA